MSPLASSLRFLQTQPDKRLLALAQEGHEAAFEALVRRYRRQLLSYCRRLLGSESAAEDVLQQALLQAWVAISRGTEVVDARPWLYRIVHNVAVSNLRASGNAVVELEEGPTARETDHEVEQRIAARAALAGLAALPDLQRQVMLSTAVDGRSHDEIATELGLSSGAVRGLIYRARSALRAAAAAVVPGPVVHWAARHATAQSTGSSGLYDTIAGTGSAGGVGLLLKGGAVIASAGALATAVGITANHRPARLRITTSHETAIASSTAAGLGAPAQGSTGGGGAGLTPGSPNGQPVRLGGNGPGSSVQSSNGRGPDVLVAGGVSFGSGSSNGGHDGRSSGHDGGSNPGDFGSGSGGRDGGSQGASGGSSGGGSSGGGSSGGHDGGHSGGSGGDGVGTTTGPTSGGGAGTTGPTSGGGGTSGGSDGGSGGGSTGGSGGGSSGGSSGGDGGSSGGTTTDTSGGGSGDHSSSGGDSTQTTTTTTTTTTSSTSGD